MWGGATSAFRRGLWPRHPATRFRRRGRPSEGPETLALRRFPPTTTNRNGMVVNGLVGLPTTMPRPTPWRPEP